MGPQPRASDKGGPRMSGPVAAYGLYNDWRWVAWIPCASRDDARRLAQAAVARGEANRYVVYDRSGLAMEKGPAA